MSKIEFDSFQNATYRNIFYFVTNSSYEVWKTGTSWKFPQERKRNLNIMRTEDKALNLLAERFTRFLKIKETDINSEDA